jgi:misacylated tRNA(Ala) deacylase
MEPYIEDPYKKEFDAVIKEVNQDKFIVLDKSYFYPNSGGQPFDTGTITRDNEIYNVVYVGKFSGKISHEVDKPGLNAGDKVHCKINWERRYKLMRYHTAAHILSALLFKETGAEITGNQLSLEKSRIDFSLEEFDRDLIKSFEEKFNNIIDKAYDVKSEIISREEAENIPELVKLAKGLPEKVKEIRIVNIEGFDKQACGGTHVKNIKEIGHIEIIDMQNKGKKNRRIYFKLID